MPNSPPRDPDARPAAPSGSAMDGGDPMPVTRHQATLLAELATDMRPHGARQWDRAGVVHAIGRVNHLALADVTSAVTRGASDATLHTPAAIGDPSSSCWRERITPLATPVRKFDRGTSCSVCSLPHDVCRSRYNDTDHAYLSSADATRRATTRPTLEQPA